MADIEKAARILDEAMRTARPVAQFGTGLSVTEAYAVQKAAFAHRLSRGERRVGVKMGFTSRAKMIQMGLEDLIWGRLTDGMIVEDGGEIDFQSYVHPRVEPEIAFLLGKPLAGVVTALQAQDAIAAAAPAMEIIDSRYQNFKFSLSDVVADNASASGFVIGAWTKRDVDLSNLGMVMSFDGRAVQMGSSAAILGNPIRALIAAARLVGEAGERLEAGDVVMAGGATSAEPLRPGLHVRLEVHSLGCAEFSVTP